MSEAKIRLFSPAEDYTNYRDITEAEVETIEWAAQRLKQDFRYNKEASKAFFGHAADFKKPKPPEAAKPLVPPGGALKWKSDGRGYAKVSILAQHYPDSCGQTSVAMCINTLRGYKGKEMWSDKTVNDKYGYGLLEALNGEIPKFHWTSPEFSPSLWDEIERKLDSGLPVIIALNGWEFSKSGRGHIMVIYAMAGNLVHLADSNGGWSHTVTKQQIEEAPPHPQGKWLMWAEPK